MRKKTPINATIDKELDYFLDEFCQLECGGNYSDGLNRILWLGKLAYQQTKNNKNDLIKNNNNYNYNNTIKKLNAKGKPRFNAEKEITKYRKDQEAKK